MPVLPSRKPQSGGPLAASWLSRILQGVDSLHLQELRRLEHVWQVAEARFRTAKQLGAVIAVLAGAFVGLRWYSELSLLAFAVGYGLALVPYWQPAAAARDAYFRAAKIGKYARNPFE